jgi:protein gp37
MGTAIEWTDETWNPVTGCTKVSPGCDNCYAERVTERWQGKGTFDKVVLHEDRLAKPLSWRKPRRVFVNSMSDLFHDDVPDEFIARAFAVMACAPQHTFQVLTKRHGRMRSLLSSDVTQQAVMDRLDLLMADAEPYAYPHWPLSNVGLGVSVEDQRWAGIRISALLDTPAAVRFLSCEPLLGPIDLTELAPGLVYSNRGFNALVGEPRIDWVIVGGESGPGARPMHPDWPRSLRDQCTAAGVPFFFKQWGEWSPDLLVNYGEGNGRRLHYERAFVRAADGSHAVLGDGGGPGTAMDRIGKHRAGRELDGRTWDEYPAVTP